MRRLIFLFALALVFTSGASAQNINDILKAFGGVMQQAATQAALTEWRKLTDTEVACIDRSLRQQGASVDSVVSHGIPPSDPRLSSFRVGCRVQVVQPVVEPSDLPSSKYVVDGLALGGQVRFDSDVYKQYSCTPSEQFSGFVWCQKTKEEQSNRGEITIVNSILHSQVGKAVYVNRYTEPAFFRLNEVRAEIDRLSTKFGERARQMPMPQREGLPSATIAIWGKVELAPLDSNDVAIVASGGSPHKGLLVSFLGDLQRSAKAGLPVYRLTGGPGFLWSATFNSDGRGVLRYLTIDPLQIEKNVAVAKRDQPSPKSDNGQTGGPYQPIPPSKPKNENRIALVIGNSSYVNVSQLPNPKRDADLLGKLFNRLGFQKVELKMDVTKAELTAALGDFAREAETADWAVIYYAGHGIEIGGVDYVVPVDARLRSDRDVVFEAVELDKLMSAVERAKKLHLVILDACRENPFARQMARSIVSRAIERGLAPVEPEPGTLVVFAAKHGQVAMDGGGSNSPFVRALATRLVAPNLEIRRMFDLVRDDVIEATEKKQQPFTYGSLSGNEDFFFVQR